MIGLRIAGIEIDAVGPPDPGLKILTYLQLDPSPKEGGEAVALDFLAKVTVGEIEFAHRMDLTQNAGQDLHDRVAPQISVFVPLCREGIQRIESRREHNVVVRVTIILRYFDKDHRIYSTVPQTDDVNIPQNEWISYLDKMGFRGGWVLEVERPEVEGWPSVAQFLERAAVRIASRDAEGAIVQCRAAWDSLSPLFESKSVLEGIGAEVDRGSTPEEGQPRKSERIFALKKATLKWCNTGPHSAFYAATMDDALLAYRLTASMVAYLSRKAVQAEAHSSDREPPK